ncbi:MAG: hypothetical protein IJW80_02570, partial [Alistipes sp.]|nr:hypothetical protein [Alistipes sp.]
MKHSFYLFGMFTMCLLFSCSKAVNEPSAQMQNGSTADEVANCNLIRSLHAYNDSLYVANGLARIYNPSTNNINHSQSRNSNNWKIYYKDAKGALRGARMGFRFGMGFSPSGAIAGAAVGAILNGALGSAIEYWKQNHLIVPNPNEIPDLIVSDSIFQPQTLYDIALSIEFDIAISRPLDIGLNMRPEIEAMGLAHNVLLDKIIGGGDTTNDFGPIDDGSDLPPSQPIITLSYINTLFEDEFTAEMIASEIFQQDFIDLVEQELEEST